MEINVSFAFNPLEETRDRERILSEIEREERFNTGLQRNMSPAEKEFSQEVKRQVHDMLERMDNRAATIIRSIFDQYFLKSRDSVSSIGEAVRIKYKPENSALNIIMGIVSVGLAHGRYHEKRGKLSETGMKMLDIWRFCSDALCVAGISKKEEMNSMEKELLEIVSMKGIDPPKTILEWICSFFKKPKIYDYERQ